MSQYKFVLYADDDIDDKDWVKEACRALGYSLSMIFVDNGRQVLEYLSTQEKEQLPALIVLDLNMPELDGRQTLRRLKANPLYEQIPVAIVTTSTNRIDQEVCRKLGATLFLTKPYNHQEWQNIIQQLVPYIN